MNMHTDVSTPFENLPELSALHRILEIFWETREGKTVVSEEPFLVYKDGSLCTSLRGEMGTMDPINFSEYYDVWDELLLIKQGIATEHYSICEIAQLEKRARGLRPGIVQLCNMVPVTRERHYHS